MNRRHEAGPDRLGDVLQARVVEIADRKIEPRPDLAIGILGKCDGARRRDAFQPCRDVDATPALRASTGDSGRSLGYISRGDGGVSNSRAAPQRPALAGLAIQAERFGVRL